MNTQGGMVRGKTPTAGWCRGRQQCTQYGGMLHEEAMVHTRTHDGMVHGEAVNFQSP